MKVKVSESKDAVLDWMVAKAEGVRLEYGLTDDERYSTDWSQGGPIIEREKIDTDFCHFTGPWFACIGGKSPDVPERARAYGPTSLIAAMRCYVTVKLGDEVEVPKELL